uniref:Uncharacterized protein n=1 Tax=Monodelphis domestica TaxID=13616 RepID=A0A5F8HD38_MONDO
MVAEEPQQQKVELLDIDSEEGNCSAYDEAIMAQQDQIQLEIAVQNPEKQTSVAELLASFNDQSASDYLMLYLWLKFLKHFMEGEMSIKEFCQQEVELMCKDSVHIHIILLRHALSFFIPVEYFDPGRAAPPTPTCAQRAQSLSCTSSTGLNTHGHTHTRPLLAPPLHRSQALDMDRVFLWL